MNRFFTLLLAASCLTAVGQVTYPYNPDGNADGDITVGDLQDFLVTYGNPFSPSEILVNGEALTTVLTQLQNSIDSLFLTSSMTPFKFHFERVTFDNAEWLPLEGTNLHFTEYTFESEGFLHWGQDTWQGNNAFIMSSDFNLEIEANHADSIYDNFQSTFSFNSTHCIPIRSGERLIITRNSTYFPAIPFLDWFGLDFVNPDEDLGEEFASQNNSQIVEYADDDGVPNEGDTLEISGDIDVLTIALKTELDSMWRVLGETPSGVAYELVSKANLAEALQNNFQYVYHFGPARSPMVIDISDVTSDEIIIRFNEVEELSALLPFFADLAPNVPNGASFYAWSYQLSIISDGYNVGEFEAFRTNRSFSFWDGAVSSVQTSNMLYGSGIKTYHKLPSGQFIQK